MTPQPTFDGNVELVISDTVVSAIEFFHQTLEKSFIVKLQNVNNHQSVHL